MQPQRNERFTSRELSPVPELNAKRVATEIVKGLKKPTKMRKPRYTMKLRHIENVYTDYESRLPSPPNHVSTAQHSARKA